MVSRTRASTLLRARTNILAMILGAAEMLAREDSSPTTVEAGKLHGYQRL